MTKKAYIIAGGTMVHIAPHFSICAPAYGTVGHSIYEHLNHYYIKGKTDIKPELILTKMAGDLSRSIIDMGYLKLETNDELDTLIKHLINLDDTKCIILAAAVCDWKPDTLESNYFGQDKFGKHTQRLKTSDGNIKLELSPADKIIQQIRKDRKDIFLVGFKATTTSTKEEAYKIGLESLKTNSANIVFTNDLHSGTNIVITPEEYPYYFNSSERDLALDFLAQMIVSRTKLSYKRTKLVGKDFIKPHTLQGYIPDNFIPVLQYLIDNKAYKPFKGKTTGHFGCLVWNQPFKTISSVRKTNHNNVFKDGMVPIYGEDSDGRIVVTGAKPSVGEHTQQKIYKQLDGRVHSIVHFHCELKDGINFPISAIKEQFYYECGSNECAKNAATGMTELEPGIFAVHLNCHGPNIAFHKDVDPKNVMEIINKYWDLNEKTGGNLDEV